MGFLIPVVAALIGIIGVIMLMISDAKPTRRKFLAGGLIVLLWFVLAGLTYLHNEGDARLKTRHATKTQRLKDRIDEHDKRAAKHATELAEHVQQERKLENEIQRLKDRIDEHDKRVAKQPSESKEVVNKTLQFEIPDTYREVCKDIIIVPAGKQLVIEYASGNVRLPAGQKLRHLQIRTIKLDGQKRTPSYFDLSVTPTGVFNEFKAGQTVKLYADPKSQVAFCAGRDKTSQKAYVRVVISGYLIDSP